MAFLKREHKYNAKSVTVDGIKFASKREASRWTQLRILERAGEIKDLARQVPFDLAHEGMFIRTPTGRIMKYVADFAYTDKAGRFHIEDAKGMDTPEGYLKRQIVRAFYGHSVDIV